MKKNSNLIVIIMLCVIGTVSGSEVAGARNDGCKVLNKSERKIKQKSKNIIIPRIDFEDITVETAVRRLCEQSKQFDKESVGINIILQVKNPRVKNRKVDLVLVKRNVYQAIYFLCIAANLKFRFEKDAVVIIDKNDKFEKNKLMVRQEPNTLNVKDLHFLQGESPCQVRLSKPICIECCATLGGIEMNDVLLIDSIKQTFDFRPNDSCEAYTENCIDRKGNRTSLKQFSLVTSIKAVGHGVILSETNTKEPLCKALEELPGSKSVVCAERNVGNLGDPFGSCLARKELPTKRRHSGYLRGVRSFHSTLRRESRPHGEGNDVITQPAQEKWSRQGELEITMQTSLQGIATGQQMSPSYLTEVF